MSTKTTNRIAVLCLTGLLAFCGTLKGGEDWEGFLQALISRHYYDTAIDYLESFRNNPDCPAALASELDFRQGICSLNLARTLPAEQKKQLLNKSRDQILTFLKTNSEHAMALDALTSLARIYIDEGKTILAQSQKAKDAAADTLARHARDSFDEGGKYLEQATELALKRAREFQSSGNANGLDENQIYGSWLALKIQAASLEADRARSFTDKESQKKGLESARDQLREISQKYRDYAGSFNAKFLEAQIDIDLNDIDAAKAILTELALLPMEPTLYALKTQTLLMQGELDLKEKNPDDLFRFLEKYYQWKQTAALPQQYYVSLEGLKLHLIATESLIELAKYQQSDRAKYNKNLKNILGQQDTPLSKILTARNRLASWASEQLKFILARRSPLAIDAEKLMKNVLFVGEDGKDASTPVVMGKTFEELAMAASRSWMAILQKNQESQSGNANAKPDPESVHSAYELFRRAEALIEPSSPKDKIDRLYFEWASLSYLDEQYAKAWELSDKLCHNEQFPDAVKAAKLALYSLRKLYAETDGKTDATAQRAELESKIQKLAAYINERWGKDTSDLSASVVQESLTVQMDAAIEKGNPDEAKKLLDQIPENSPQRADAEIQFGISLWNAYSKAVSQSADQRKNDDSSPENNTKSIQRMKQLLESAGAILEKGMSRRLALPGVAAENYYLVYSALSLAQIYLAKNDIKNAEKWLTHPVIGPLNLVTAEIGATQKQDSNADNNSQTSMKPNALAQENFQLATLIIALRIDVANNNFAQAEKTMTLLESIGKGKSDRILAIYIYLGRQLESQVAELSNAARSGDTQKAAELKSVSSGFEKLLEKISAKSEGNTYITLRWVADTFLSLARGMSGGLSTPSPEAIAYYTKAGRTCQNILKKLKADPAWSPDPNATLSTSIRLSECLRGTGRYDAAIKILTGQLASHENNLELQMETARTLQDRGRIDKDWYARAITGTLPDATASQSVWGWNRIISRLAKVIDKEARFKELFYEAYINKLTCRFLYLRRLPDEKEMKKQAVQSQEEILRLYKTHPDLGGPATRRQIEDQYRRFQKQQGINPPVDLPKQ